MGSTFTKETYTFTYGVGDNDTDKKAAYDAALVAIAALKGKPLDFQETRIGNDMRVVYNIQINTLSA